MVDVLLKDQPMVDSSVNFFGTLLVNFRGWYFDDNFVNMLVHIFVDIWWHLGYVLVNIVLTTIKLTFMPTLIHNMLDQHFS